MLIIIISSEASRLCMQSLAGVHVWGQAEEAGASTVTMRREIRARSEDRRRMKRILDAPPCW